MALLMARANLLQPELALDAPLQVAHSVQGVVAHVTVREVKLDGSGARSGGALACGSLACRAAHERWSSRRRVVLCRGQQAPSAISWACLFSHLAPLAQLAALSGTCKLRSPPQKPVPARCS